MGSGGVPNRTIIRIDGRSGDCQQREQNQTQDMIYMKMAN